MANIDRASSLPGYRQQSDDNDGNDAGPATATDPPQSVRKGPGRPSKPPSDNANKVKNVAGSRSSQRITDEAVRRKALEDEQRANQERQKLEQQRLNDLAKAKAKEEERARKLQIQQEREQEQKIAAASKTKNKNTPKGTVPKGAAAANKPATEERRLADLQRFVPADEEDSDDDGDLAAPAVVSTSSTKRQRSTRNSLSAAADAKALAAEEPDREEQQPPKKRGRKAVERKPVAPSASDQATGDGASQQVITCN